MSGNHNRKKEACLTIDSRSFSTWIFQKDIAFFWEFHSNLLKNPCRRFDTISSKIQTWILANKIDQLSWGNVLPSSIFVCVSYWMRVRRTETSYLLARLGNCPTLSIRESYTPSELFKLEKVHFKLKTITSMRFLQHNAATNLQRQ